MATPSGAAASKKEHMSKIARASKDQPERLIKAKRKRDEKQDKSAIVQNHRRPGPPALFQGGGQIVGPAGATSSSTQVIQPAPRRPMEHREILHGGETYPTGTVQMAAIPQASQRPQEQTEVSQSGQMYYAGSAIAPSAAGGFIWAGGMGADPSQFTWISQYNEQADAILPSHIAAPPQHTNTLITRSEGLSSANPYMGYSQAPPSLPHAPLSQPQAPPSQPSFNIEASTADQNNFHLDALASQEDVAGISTFAGVSQADFQVAQDPRFPTGTVHDASSLPENLRRITRLESKIKAHADYLTKLGNAYNGLHTQIQSLLSKLDMQWDEEYEQSIASLEDE
ncbi:hypothetical protein AURDEDRAFT_175712 [Auricularia subglabra TFB-10046 SS5]|nr:hypothetical protein AURDEDRAFT_175712 [Auricularia subglabra TFB-10046 SS5]